MFQVEEWPFSAAQEASQSVGRQPPWNVAVSRGFHAHNQPDSAFEGMGIFLLASTLRECTIPRPEAKAGESERLFGTCRRALKTSRRFRSVHLIEVEMRVNFWPSVFLCAVVGITCHAQTFTSLVSLTDATGAEPLALGQQANGMLWVTTFVQGKFNCGTLFQTTLLGKLSGLRNFSCKNGNAPQGLTPGTDGSYYGVTFSGGPGNGGNCF